MTKLDYAKEYLKELPKAINGFEAIKRMTELDLSISSSVDTSIDDGLDFRELTEKILKNLNTKKLGFENLLIANGIDPYGFEENKEVFSNDHTKSPRKNRCFLRLIFWRKQP